MLIQAGFPRSRRVLAATLLAIQLAGCSQWVPAAQPVPETVEKHPKALVRLTLCDGRQVKLAQPRMISDSVLGLDPVRTRRAGARGPTGQQDTVEVALVDISRMEIEKGSRSAPAIIAGVVLLAVVAAVVADQAVENSDMGF